MHRDRTAYGCAAGDAPRSRRFRSVLALVWPLRGWLKLRKGSGVAVLPGKLTDCESRDLLMNEFFLVECDCAGDRAGGSAKMSRNQETQFVQPLRGKVLNPWEVERDRRFANIEIHDIAVALGVDPHGPNDEPDMSGLRRGKVCILSDVGVDGAQMQVPLPTLFFRHFPKRVERGHV